MHTEKGKCHLCGGDLPENRRRICVSCSDEAIKNGANIDGLKLLACSVQKEAVFSIVRSRETIEKHKDELRVFFAQRMQYRWELENKGGAKNIAPDGECFLFDDCIISVDYWWNDAGNLECNIWCKRATNFS